MNIYLATNKQKLEQLVFRNQQISLLIHSNHDELDVLLNHFTYTLDMINIQYEIKPIRSHFTGIKAYKNKAISYKVRNLNLNRKYTKSLSLLINVIVNNGIPVDNFSSRFGYRLEYSKKFTVRCLIS